MTMLIHCIIKLSSRTLIASVIIHSSFTLIIISSRFNFLGTRNPDPLPIALLLLLLLINRNIPTRFHAIARIQAGLTVVLQ